MDAKPFLGYLVATFGVPAVAIVATAILVLLKIHAVLPASGVARSIPPVGVAGATTAIILGQVFTAAVLDFFGLFGLEKISFNWYRILGALAMAGGAWLLLRRQ